jgi:o-succinylbenzoate---CoA ligase
MSPDSPRRLVAVDLPAGRDLVAAVDTVWADGDAVLALPRELPPARRADLLDAMRPSALVDRDGRQAMHGGEPVREGTAAVVVTSGSTGRPKGVVLGHHALTSSAAATAARIGQRPGDRWLCCLPLSHIAGLQILVRARLGGHDPVVHSRFDPAAIAAVAETGAANLVSLVPTMLVRLLDAGIDLSGFRTVLLGGSAPPIGVLERAREAGVHVTVTYGMTETCGGCVYDGVPLDGVEVATTADDRIRIRGPVLLDGYRGSAQPAVLDADGWFTTSDLGRWEEGRLVVLGRADDVIITGGENVVATQVEAALADHPAVADVAVIGRADPEWGERVVAVVVPVGDPPSKEELRAHARSRLPRYAVPREVEFADTLPLLDAGKVDRAALRGGTRTAEQR